IPIAHSQDTVGPFGRTVADVAALLGALTGVDPRDAATSASAGRFAADYTRFLDKDGLRGARLGIAREVYFGYSEKTDVIAEAAIAAMEAAGAVIIDPADIPTAKQMGESHAELEVLHYEFKADLDAYLAGLNPEAAHSLEDVIAFNEAHREQEMPYFGQEHMLAAQAKGPLTEQKYIDELAQNLKMSRTDGIDATMTKYNLDAIVAPTGGPAWVTDLLNGDHFSGASSTPAAVAGYPNINVPAGFSHELPIGISFFGRAWSEPTLIRIAYAFEQATKHRRAPKFIPTLGV
ncbi:MAG TPA: amidase family protein, partial [Gemmatimonadaceae bacterium]|nr:amidase family protein [Gemmatimonadaceae bacterium]